MVAKVAAWALLALVCLAATVQAQPYGGDINSMFPSGNLDNIDAVMDAISKQPGAVVASTTAISGQPVRTYTSGTGVNGQAMASGSVTDASGRVQTSTTINGVTTTTVSGGRGATVNAGSATIKVSNAVPKSGLGLCNSVSETNSKACDGPKGACCAVSSSVKRCKDFISATSKVNGVPSRCCVTLLRAKDKSPALWCAGPPSKAYYSIPPTASVVMKPSCSSSIAKSTSGSAACIVTFPTLPAKFIAPAGFTPTKPLVYNKKPGKNPFQPCMSGYSRVIQVDNVGKKKETILTSKCE